MKFTKFIKFEEKDTWYPFLFLLQIAIAALAVAVYYYFTGENSISPWQTVPELQQVSMPAGQFNLLLENFDLRVKGFVLTERFDVNLPQLNLTAAYFALSFISISLVYYLSVISRFRQIAFFAAILPFMLFLTTFNFDVLGIFQEQKQYILISVMTLLGGVTFLFHAFFTRISFGIRIIVFTFLWGGLLLFLFKASPYSPAQTTLHLTNYSAEGCILAAVFFIFWVSFENIHGLLWFNTQAKQPEKRFGLWQFMLISSLYLISLLLTYLQNTRIFSFDLQLINVFLILIVSSLIGLWGLRQRQQHYNKFFSYEGGAVFLYLVFAILTFTTIGYAFATANDPLIRAASDTIVYTHLAFGAIFFAYIFINFGPLLSQKLRVYRVVYDPKTIPFYMVYVMGGVLLLALLLRTNYSLPRKAMAGYYNYLGDYYKATHDTLLAERFYNEGSVYDNNNVKSAFALAGIYHDKNYRQAEINMLNDALVFYPSAKVYAHLANKYTDRQYFFNQRSVLKNSLTQFPKSGHLLNNQALLYATTAIIDSAEYFFQKAQNYLPQKEIAQSNRLAFYLTSGLGQQALQLAQNQEKNSYLPLQSNLLLLQCFTGKKFVNNTFILPEGHKLTPENFAGFYHAAMLGQSGSDQATLGKINQYLKEANNYPYHFDLAVLKAHVQARRGYTLAARTTLENLAGTNEEYSAYLLDLIGLQLMEKKLYAAAAEHFAKAQAKDWPDAGVHLLYALALQHNKQVDALLLADQLTASESPGIARLANRVKYLIQAHTNQILAQPNDSVKVQYLQLNQDTAAISPQEYMAVASTVRNPDLKKIAQKELTRFLVLSANYDAATQVLQGLLPQLNEQDALLSEVNQLQAQILLKTNNLPQLETALPRMYLAGHDQKVKHYYNAVLAEKQNKIQEAKKRYNVAVQVLPYHEPTVLAAANFYSAQKDNNRAYDILLNSITYNPYSARVYQAYILKSIEIGYSGFAESALEELAKLLPAEAFANFRKQYEQKLAQRQAALQNWR
ncbi:tetratricopeptide repeat protein [Adhaeribacter aquaticus]|uniref:tetratricopeptide repeat protein n=1 Tax=Adhaeribacter aquaticus TaxID=299567 RepID=UPI000414053F|nr:hypothetical protein [Adhaeribacter aquaticus]